MMQKLTTSNSYITNICYSKPIPLPGVHLPEGHLGCNQNSRKVTLLFLLRMRRQKGKVGLDNVHDELFLDNVSITVRVCSTKTNVI